MAERAVIRLDIEHGQAVRNLGEIQGELRELQPAADRSTSDVVQNLDRLARESDSATDAVHGTVRGFERLESASAGATTGMTGVAKTGNRANEVLLDVGAGAGDAAFGIRGVANNIPQAITAFRRLRTDAGGTAAAFASLRSALFGIGGVIFLAQLLPILGELTRNMDLFGDSTEDANQSLEDLRETAEKFVDVAKDDVVLAIHGLEFATIQAAEAGVDKLNDSIKSLKDEEDELLDFIRPVTREISDQGGAVSEDMRAVEALRMGFLRMSEESLEAIIGPIDQTETLGNVLSRASNIQADMNSRIQNTRALEKELSANIQERRDQLQQANIAQSTFANLMTETGDESEETSEGMDDASQSAEELLGWFSDMERQVQDLGLEQVADDFLGASLNIGKMNDEARESRRVLGDVIRELQSMSEEEIITQAFPTDPIEEVDIALDDLDIPEWARESEEELTRVRNVWSDIGNVAESAAAQQAASAAESAESAGDVANAVASAVRESIAARAAEVVATQVAKVIRNVPWPLNIALAAAAAASTSAMFNAVVPEFAHGGFVSGPGGPRDDAVPAMLSDGEFVVNAGATQAFRPMLEGINSMQSGGPVRANRPSFGREQRIIVEQVPAGQESTVQSPQQNDRLIREVRALRSDVRDLPPSVGDLDQALRVHRDREENLHGS